MVLLACSFDLRCCIVCSLSYTQPLFVLQLKVETTATNSSRRQGISCVVFTEQGVSESRNRRRDYFGEKDASETGVSKFGSGSARM